MYLLRNNIIVAHINKCVTPSKVGCSHLNSSTLSLTYQVFRIIRRLLQTVFKMAKTTRDGQVWFRQPRKKFVSIRVKGRVCRGRQSE